MEVLQTTAQRGVLTGEQFLEAMRLIQEIEKKETIDWNKILNTLAKFGGLLIYTIVVIILTGVTQGKNRKA